MNAGQIIAEQIGHKAFFMLGAQNISPGEDALTFKIRGCRTISHIRIVLEPSDTYTVDFYKLRKHDLKLMKSVPGVYVDGLHQCIERSTGLYTSL